MVDSDGVKNAGFIDMTGDYIGRDYMSGVWIWVSEEISKGDGVPCVIIGKAILIKLDHLDGYEGL